MDKTDPKAAARIRELEASLAEARQKIDSLEGQDPFTAPGVGSADSALLFYALFEHALDAIIIANDRGRYVAANPAAAQLFGLPRAELVGKTAADFGPPDLDFETVWEHFLHSPLEKGEFPVHRPDGTVRYAEYAAVSDILPGYHLSILRDVTARKRLEAEREQALADLKALAATLEARVAERTEALEQRGRQLQEMAAALAVAEQRERERISRILHDDLQQLLYAAQLRVVMLDEDVAAGATGQVQEALAELDLLNDRALAVTRSVTVELRPPVLKAGGLAEALSWLVGHMETTHGLRVELAVEEVELASEDLSELAFQMVRELLFNVIQHAGVKQARLDAFRHGDRCTIVVADGGRGFDVAVSRQRSDGPGYGLYAIKERVQLFGGTFQVESAPGAGTEVVLTLPVRRV